MTLRLCGARIVTIILSLLYFRVHEGRGEDEEGGRHVEECASHISGIDREEFQDDKFRRRVREGPCRGEREAEESM